MRPKGSYWKWQHLQRSQTVGCSDLRKLSVSADLTWWTPETGRPAGCPVKSRHLLAEDWRAEVLWDLELRLSAHSSPQLQGSWLRSGDPEQRLSRTCRGRKRSKSERNSSWRNTNSGAVPSDRQSCFPEAELQKKRGDTVTSSLEVTATSAARTRTSHHAGRYLWLLFVRNHDDLSSTDSESRDSRKAAPEHRLCLLGVCREDPKWSLHQTN